MSTLEYQPRCTSFAGEWLPDAGVADSADKACNGKAKDHGFLGQLLPHAPSLVKP